MEVTMEPRTHLPQIGFIRLREVLTFIPVSKSTWFEGIREGKYPPPVKLSSRVSAYPVQDILNLIQELGKKIKPKNSEALDE